MLECVATEGILTTALFCDLLAWLLDYSAWLLRWNSVPCSRALECSAVAAERVQCSSRAAAVAASASSSKTSLSRFSSWNCYYRVSLPRWISIFSIFQTYCEVLKAINYSTTRSMLHSIFSRPDHRRNWVLFFYRLWVQQSVMPRKFEYCIAPSYILCTFTLTRSTKSTRYYLALYFVH